MLKLDKTKPNLARWELVFLAILISASLTFFHFILVDKFARASQIAWYNNIISNHGPYPDQYRILTYILAKGLMSIGIGFTGSFMILRFIFTAGSIYIFYRYLEHWFRPMTTLAGLFMMIAVMPVTYLFYVMQPTDPLNMLVFFATFWVIQQEKDKWLIPLVVIGMLNRETAILIPLIFALARFKIKPLKEWLPNFFISSLLAFAIYFGLRLIFGLKAPYAETSPLHYWHSNLTDWQTWFQLIGFFYISLLMAWRNFSQKPLFIKRVAWILPIFLFIHFTVGYMREVRYFLPLLPILIPMVLFNLENRFSSQKSTIKTPGFRV